MFGAGTRLLQKVQMMQGCLGIEENCPQTLILGIGDPQRGDDGVGHAVIRRLETQSPKGVELQRHWGEGTALMAAWKGWERVILVDAMVSSGTPGSLRWFEGEALPPPGLFPYSTHRFGVAEALRMAAVLGELPGSWALLGIEGESFQAGNGLSPAVAAAVERACVEILARISTVPRAAPRSASR